MDEALGAEPGKIASLQALLKEHAEPVEADLAHHYPGRSLKELFRGSMSYRELWVLVKHLPPESWTQTALRDSDLDELEELTGPEPEPEPEDRFGPWSKADYQRAQLIDAIRENTYAVSIAGQLEPKPDPPSPLPRPGLVRRKQAPPALSEAAVLYLNRLRPTGG